jgi:UDP-N-acetylmuramyl pentapeptide phosphotransferase/UDP-N-acetylglucosamine-1-phosphate transferase
MQTKTIGIIVIIIGVLMFVFTGFNFTTKEKVVDLGPVQIDKEKNHPVRWSPIIGGILVVGGIVLVAVNKKK